MLRELKFFFKKPLIKYPAAVAAIFSLVQVVALIIRIKPSTEPIYLHYTTYLGVDFVGAWYLAYLLPVASFFCAIVNTVLAFTLVKRDALLAYILTVGAAIVALLLCIQTILIIRLNA